MAEAMSVISGMFSQVSMALAVPSDESTRETFSWNFSLMASKPQGFFWLPRTSSREVVFKHHVVPIRSLAWTTLDDELVLASGDKDGTICLWSPDGHLIRAIESHHGMVNSLEFSRDGSRLLSGHGDGNACIWPVRTEDLLDLAYSRLR